MKVGNVDNEVTIVIVFNQMMVNSGLNVDSPDISHLNVRE